jgi:anthranilate phosphoribosyltransferase
MSLTSLIARVSDGEYLTADEAESAFHTVMSGEASPVQIAALLMSLRTRGHSPSEVAGGVRALRRAMVPVAARDPGELVDTCGTGGGAVTTFNVSTAAALVTAGAGVRVAKHGNRSFTSRSGSADVLEALGVRIDMSPEAMARVLEAAGIVFMFAPLLHPAMRHVGPVRRELGVSTIMNLLGPLTNPAGVRRQVVGVADPALIPLVIDALQELGHLRALVVHGEPGMDEISPLGPTTIAELRDGEVKTWKVRPEEVGLSEAKESELSGGSPEENARVIESVIRGEGEAGAMAITLMNAAAALLVADAVSDLRAGVDLAREAIGSGAAQRALDRLREASNAEAPDV